MKAPLILSKRSGNEHKMAYNLVFEDDWVRFVSRRSRVSFIRTQLRQIPGMKEYFTTNYPKATRRWSFFGWSHSIPSSYFATQKFSNYLFRNHTKHYFTIMNFDSIYLEMTTDIEAALCAAITAKQMLGA